MGIIIKLCFFLCFAPLTGILLDNTPAAQATSPEKISSEMLWNIDFTTFPDDVRQELLNRNFQFKKAMTDKDKIQLSFDNHRLNISTNKPAFGLLVREDLHLEQADSVEIVWGITSYPEKADWSNGKNQEALMIYFFFGEPVGADRFYLPDSPYFIGLFLGQHEDPLTPYKGKSYSKTGRYICLGNPPPGQAITSRFNLADAYRDMFSIENVPPITGVAIEVDTGSLEDGKASSFIQRISLKKADNT